jgi:hypothetical protein
MAEHSTVAQYKYSMQIQTTDVATTYISVQNPRLYRLSPQQRMGKSWTLFIQIQFPQFYAGLSVLNTGQRLRYNLVIIN